LIFSVVTYLQSKTLHGQKARKFFPTGAIMNPNPDRPVRAALMMLAASALFASTTLLAKYLGSGDNALHPFQVSAGRFVFAFLGVAMASLVLRPRLTRPNLGLHFLRTFSGWAGVSLIFAAVARIAISDATAITFLNPVFGMLLAIVILREKVGPIRWLAAGIAFVGMLILLRPGTGSFQPGALLALAAAAVIGLEVTLVKLLSGREAPLQILLVNNAMGALIALIAASFVWQMPTTGQWAALIAVGLVMVCGQALFIQSMRAGEASYVLPFSYATLVFATLYDFWIYGIRPDATSLIGAGVILAGAMLLVWREAVNRR